MRTLFLSEKVFKRLWTAAGGFFLFSVTVRDWPVFSGARGGRGNTVVQGNAG